MDELSLLTKIVKEYKLRGRRQHLPSQVEGCYSPLSLSDIIDHALPDVEVDAAFSRSN